jgi:SAM-dependent methyltransferase
MDQPRLPRYGIDAPGFVWGFLGTALGLTVVGVAILTEGPPPFNLLGILVLLLALGPASLGISMLLYAFVGKQRLRDHLLRQRVWRGEEVVLDIGSGRGLMAIGAAQRAPMGKVIAIDIWSAKDLTGNTPEALRENAITEGVDQIVEIASRDARALGLADASVDVVVSVFCLHNIEPEVDREKACREIARVLKPGGVALIADFPGAGPYVPVLRAAGLDVAGPFRAEPIALGIAGYLVASKEASIEQHSALRLALLGGSQPEVTPPPRRPR